MDKLDSFIMKVNAQIVNPLIVLLFALALAFFLWGVFEFLLNQDNDEKKTTGKSHMLWGVIGMTLMMAVWGILSIILSTLNIPKSDINPEEGTVDLPDYTPSLNYSNLR